jgi:hypothetical protein
MCARQGREDVRVKARQMREARQGKYARQGREDVRSKAEEMR